MTNTKAGEVINGIGVTQDGRVRRDVTNVVLEQRDASGSVAEVLLCAVHEIVDHDDWRPASRELPDQFGPDEPGAAGDNDRRPAAHEVRRIEAGSGISISSRTARSIVIKSAASID